GALDEAAAGDGAAVPRLGEQRGEGRAADDVDRARPTARLERPAALLQLRALDELGCPEPFEIAAVVEVPSRRDDVASGGGEQHDGDRPEAARGARHDDVAVG